MISLTSVNRLAPGAICVSAVLLLTACDSGGGGGDTAVSTETASKVTTKATEPAPAAPEATPDAGKAATDLASSLSETQTKDQVAKVQPVGTEFDLRKRDATGKPETTIRPAEPEMISNKHLVIAEPANVDLGAFPTGETKVGTITLINTGDRPMKLGKPRSTCGCTTVQTIAGTILEPEQTLDVEVRMKGGNVARVLNKSVTFNVEGQPPLVVPVRGEAIAFIELDPKQLDPTVHTDGRLVLKSVDDTPFRVINMIPRVLEEFPEEASTEVELFLPWDKFGDLGFRRKVIVYTDHPKCQQVYLDIKLTPEQRAQQANIDTRQNDTARPQRRNYEQMIAAGQNDEVIKLVIGGEIDIDMRDPQSGAALLGLAAKKGNIELVERLLERGADTEVADKAGRTPLMAASESKDTDIVSALLDAGASTTARDNIGGTALSWAAAFGSPQQVEMLVEAGSDIHSVGVATGYTPLIWAAGFGDPASIDVLVDAGADIEATDLLEGLTPVMHAARTGKLEGIGSLVEHGADLEAQDREGRTAFLTTAVNSGGTVEKLQMLIDLGSDVAATDKRGDNALQLAQRRTDANAAQVVDFLQTLGLGEGTDSGDGE